jgi:uncharacterized protein with beta-barrel porin domain
MFGYNKYDSSRKINVGSINETANSNYNGNQLVVKSGVGYNYRLNDKLFISPSFTLGYSIIELDDYQEQNAYYGLDVENERFNNFQSEIGFKIMTQFNERAFKYKVSPEINVSWVRNLTNKGSEAQTSFINGSSDKTNIRGIDLNDNLYNIGGQLNIARSKADSFVLKYDLQTSSGYSNHSASVNYRLEF